MTTGNSAFIATKVADWALGPQELPQLFEQEDAEATCVFGLQAVAHDVLPELAGITATALSPARLPRGQHAPPADVPETATTLASVAEHEPPMSEQSD
ncbi:MAG: hypothetical protein AAFX05_14375 [Planctomycetota bacterium]